MAKIYHNLNYLRPHKEPVRVLLIWLANIKKCRSFSAHVLIRHFIYGYIKLSWEMTPALNFEWDETFFALNFKWG